MVWLAWRNQFAALAGASYIPHIVMAWKTEPEYTTAQYVDIGMLFLIAALTSILADHERAQRHKVEENARQLTEECPVAEVF